MTSSDPPIVREPLLKRPFDFALALTGLFLSLPLAVLVAIAIVIDDGWPVLYFQDRVGRSGKRFRIWKFRSMNLDSEKDSGPIAAALGDPRVTRVGNALRRTGMDELPQLVNICRGQMSFVGPRADRPWEFEANDGNLPQDTTGRNPLWNGTKARGLSAQGPALSPPRFDQLIPNYQRRLAVRPGLTGLAQIYGRYDTPRRMKLRLDLLYINNMRLGLDLRLVLVSFWISARGKWETRQKKL